MNNLMIVMSIVIWALLIRSAASLKGQTEILKNQIDQWQTHNGQMRKSLQARQSLKPKPPLLLSTAYNTVTNHIRFLESYSGTRMKVHLADAPDTDDMTSRYRQTSYQGIKALSVQIIVNKFSNQTNIATVLDDIHLLEQGSDFLASQISMDHDCLTVKGEIYGL